MTALPDSDRFRSAGERIEAFAAARRHLLAIVEGLPNRFFEEMIPACRYRDFHSGADFVHYMAEHTNYHDGQLQTLEMVYSKP